MGAWVSDVRYALRGWRRQPVFVAIAVLSLAAGIGLNTAVFSIVNAIFLQSIRGVPHPDRVAAIGTRVTFATFRDLRDSVRDARRRRDLATGRRPAALPRRRAARASCPRSPTSISPCSASAPGADGSSTSQHQRVPVANTEVVVDFEFWRDALGSDPQAIGQTILINDTPATIRGIAPRAFHGFGPERPPLWMPLGMLPAVRGTAPRWDDAGESGWRVFGRIPDGGSIEQVNAELAALSAREPHRFPAEPLLAATGGERFAGAVSAEKRIEFLLVVVLPLVVVALILWIGCSNVANLLLARAAARRKEIAIRMANGAGRIAPDPAAAHREPPARARRRCRRTAPRDVVPRSHLGGRSRRRRGSRSSSTSTCCSTPAASASRRRCCSGWCRRCTPRASTLRRC